MSLCSSALFSLQVWGPALLMRFNPLHSALGSSDRCLANCSLLDVCLHFAHHYSCLPLSGLKYWGGCLTSYILKASQSLSCWLNISQTFDSFSEHSKKWRIWSWLLCHRRPDEDSQPRPVQMGRCYSVLAVTDRTLMGSDAMWSGRE
jgi:hypothetical protein